MLRLRTFILALLLGALSTSPSFAVAWPTGSTGTNIGATLPTEMSGITWDNPTGKLYAIADEGTLSRMERDGASPITWNVSGAPDLEAVAVTGTTFYLYLGVEFDSTSGTARILQVPSNTLPASSATLVVPTKSWDLPYADLPVDATHGLEGLAFVPNGHHPYADSASGGLFYASTQQDGSIAVFDVNLGASGSVPTLIDTFTPDVAQTDISDLFYSAATRTLFVLYDTANKVIEIDTSTRAYQSIVTYSLPGTPANQEGITTLPQCPGANTQIYLANDSGGVYSFTGFPQLCATTYAAIGDATINPAAPTNNFGSDLTLTADTSPTSSFLAKFSSSAMTGPIARARLRLYVTDGTTASPSACGTTNTWSNGTVTWNTAPACSGSSFGGSANVPSNDWFSYNVTSALSSYSSFRFTGNSTNDCVATSSNKTPTLGDPTDRRPQLIVWTGAVP